MNNYILEDNFNFYEELNKSDDIDEKNEDKYCLLSKKPLDKNSITLECNHSFNYAPLYREIKNQKYNNNSLEITRLKINQIKCPYCRSVSNKLLPHVKVNDEISYTYGVNSPNIFCMINHSCIYCFKSGKNKNNVCNKPAVFVENNYYCNAHKAQAYKKTVKTCTAILKTGKNKGKECGNRCYENSDFCKKHNKI